jgi:nucleotide-binding universal stress UspA family protein
LTRRAAAPSSTLPFSKILVPVDKSENANRALEYALKLSMFTKCEMMVLHVLQDIQYSEESYLYIRELEDSLEKHAKKYLDELVNKIEKEHGIKLKAIVKRGGPVSGIMDTVKEENIDLIVMGSRGLGGFKEMLLGSVSHGVTSHAKVPVLIVK